ncbi:MAG: M42 family metallopeptidase [Firmicutes bacterium]|nr:M42 family metallopeptidase [Bacillota bacterium]
MIELIKKLCESFGPSGRENTVRSLIIEELKKNGVDFTIDTLGNLIVTKESKESQDAKKILIAAHMDEIGLMVTFIDEDGFLRFTNIGGLLKNTLPGRKVVFENGTVGIIGQEKIKNTKELVLDKLYIDIGAQSHEEAKSKVKIGDMAVFLAPFSREGNRVMAKSLDNRIGCAVVLEALKKLLSFSLPNTVYFVFTVQEEVGLRGARPVAYRLKPDFGLAIDVTRVGDTPEPEFNTNVALGKGPTVKIKDSSVICHPQVTNLMIKVAENKNIPYQPEVLERGGTDAGAIHLVREGIPSGALSIPCRYIHTPAEMVDLDDVKNSVSFLSELLKVSW